MAVLTKGLKQVGIETASLWWQMVWEFGSKSVAFSMKLGTMKLLAVDFGNPKVGLEPFVRKHWSKQSTCGICNVNVFQPWGTVAGLNQFLTKKYVYKLCY